MFQRIIRQSFVEAVFTSGLSWLQAGADLTALNKFKETPLHNAAAYNKVEVVKFIIQPVS